MSHPAVAVLAFPLLSPRPGTGLPSDHLPAALQGALLHGAPRQTDLREKMVQASRNLAVKERQEYASNLIFHAKLC